MIPWFFTVTYNLKVGEVSSPMRFQTLDQARRKVEASAHRFQVRLPLGLLVRSSQIRSNTMDQVRRKVEASTH